MLHAATALSSTQQGSAAAVRCHALVPCAGSGSRAGLSSPKQYEVLVGMRLIDHTVQAFLGVPRMASVTVVVAPHDTVYRSDSNRVKVRHVGGGTRAHSVFNGLQTLLDAGVSPDDWVLVHDAARCLVTAEQIDALVDACLGDSVGGLLALPLPDTLKAASGGRACHTVDRSDKWIAQTPQMFRLGVLYSALRSLQGSGFAGVTDEASAIEAMGLRPLLVRGSAQNFKVTYPEDFALAQALLQLRASTGHREE